MPLGCTSGVARAVAMATAVGLVPALAVAQTRLLKGSVTDDAGEPVTGAIVTITCDGASLVANTDSLGQFAAAVRSFSARCDIVISRFGFRSSSAHVEVGAFMRAPTIVLQRDRAMSTLVVGGSRLPAERGSSLVSDLGGGWRASSDWNSGRAADDVRSRTLQNVAGGERWQTESKAGYTTQSGFRFESGVVVRHGYGTPLFMSRPFADATVLPELFPAPDPGGINWYALFTLATPSRQVRGIDLSGSFQAYMRFGEPPKGSTVGDRGLRASVHFKFK